MPGQNYPTELAVEDLEAGSTIPAERIDCDECGETYVGDPADGRTCPDCRPGVPADA